MRKIVNWNPNIKTTAFFFSMLMTMLLSDVVSGQQKPATGYAPVNGLKMYYEIHGSGEPGGAASWCVHGDHRRLAWVDQ